MRTFAAEHLGGRFIELLAAPDLFEAAQQIVGAQPLLLGAAEVVDDAGLVHHHDAGRRGVAACCIECVTISVVSLSRDDDLLGQPDDLVGALRIEGGGVLVEQQQLGFDARSPSAA